MNTTIDSHRLHAIAFPPAIGTSSTRSSHLSHQLYRVTVI